MAINKKVNENKIKKDLNKKQNMGDMVESNLRLRLVMRHALPTKLYRKVHGVNPEICDFKHIVSCL